MAERKPQFKPIEKALIENLATLKSPEALTEEFKEKGFSRIELLDSVWALAARGHLEFDARRNIQVSKDHPHQLYLMPPSDL